MKRIFVLILVFSLVLSALPFTATAADIPPADTQPSIKTITYTPDYETIFPNPERGFCQHIKILSLKSTRHSDVLYGQRPYLYSGAVGATTTKILHSYIRLDDYTEPPPIAKAFAGRFVGWA